MYNSKLTVLITGASSEIGKALAEQFVMNGYNLVLISNDQKNLTVVVEEFKRKYNSLFVYPIVKDLTKEKAAKEIYEELKLKRIEIDVLVNDSGEGQRGNFWETSLERHMYLIRLNVEALTRMMQIFLPDMVARNFGKILNVGSIAGFQPGPTFAVYHATKAYVNSLSESIAEELKDTNVTVTCLCPGPVETDFFRKVGPGSVMDPDEVAEKAYKALMDGERTFVPGSINKVLIFTRRLMSKPLQAKLNKKFYEDAEE